MAGDGCLIVTGLVIAVPLFGAVIYVASMIVRGTPYSCVIDLSSCEPYLNKTTAPTSTCCRPLQQLVSGNMRCSCHIFNDPYVLNLFNITQADAMNLAQKCNAVADIEDCKTEKDNAAANGAGQPFFPVGGFSMTVGVALIMLLAIN